MAAATAIPAAGADARGNGNSGNNGQGQGSNNGQGQGSNNGQGKGSNNGQGKGPATGGTDASGGQPVLNLPDQDEAIAAVRSGAAMPLADLLAKARPDLPGTVIDARLVTMRGLLVYQIKVLSSDRTTLRTLYYDARSGARVGG